MNASMKNAERINAITSDARWAAVVARDKSADGSFYYSVKTTGIYCRPSCGARLARSENVQFHVTCEEAERAGFRPCKRCKPDWLSQQARHATIVAAVCRILETEDSIPSLAELAGRIGLSAHHFHRMFKQHTGLTPREYAASRRDERLRNTLAAKDATVTEAIFEAGYHSSGRFYANADAALGMTPARYRKGGAGAQIRFAIGQCSLGAILVAQSERGICAILMDDDPATLARDLQDRFPHAELIGDDKDFEQLVAKVIGFVELPRIGLALPLDIRGTVFQQRVWQALRAIPAGQTISYTELAQRIGAPKAVRAVASACAANTIAVAVPCHRVVRIDGSVSGYRWGIERKQALLKRETEE